MIDVSMLHEGKDARLLFDEIHEFSEERVGDHCEPDT
jgi:hypothetical protein